MPSFPIQTDARQLKPRIVELFPFFKCKREGTLY